ncbi:hypothetical protein L3X38_042387 [Prunus dulcis]|uniref:Uncharacterized protein n=1 Tax=Prunus dulcis TaxID=3755 RepID=A0AAD4UVU8_PRUDU|nr:hypothetical protein L3X38_042387 [Prunus dulcis]
MPEHEFAKLVQGGWLLYLRKKFEGTEFRDIYEQQKGKPTPSPTFYKDSAKPSGPGTMAVQVVDVEDIDLEERNEEVFLEEEDESTKVNLAEIVANGTYVCKALAKAFKDRRLMTAQISKFSGTSQKTSLIRRS